MIYKCTSCGEETYGGCLPSISCGLFLLVYAFFAGSLVAILVAATRRFIDVPFWVVAVGSVPVGIAVMVGLSWLASVIEHSWMYLRPCPKCGQRKWSKGYVKGFGL